MRTAGLLILTACQPAADTGIDPAAGETGTEPGLPEFMAEDFDVYYGVEYWKDRLPTGEMEVVFRNDPGSLRMSIQFDLPFEKTPAYGDEDHFPIDVRGVRVWTGTRLVEGSGCVAEPIISYDQVYTAREGLGLYAIIDWEQRGMINLTDVWLVNEDGEEARIPTLMPNSFEHLRCSLPRPE
ncbi:MAG: hypothetical protein AAFV53_37120 [Myxococcota bacterium]